MRRWLVRIFVFLLLGAIVNVAVAWALLFVFRYGLPPERMLGEFEATQLWEQLDLPWAVNGFVWGDESRYCGWRMVRLGRLSESGGMSDAAWVTVFVSGWPCDCMHGFDGRWRGQRLSDGWPQPDLLPLPDIQFLPISVLWPGFIVNSVLFALLLYLVASIPWMVRRLIRQDRIRRGLCPTCMYDMRGHIQMSTCPECGKAVAS